MTPFAFAFGVGLVLFFGIHSVAIVAPHWRDRQRAAHPLAWRAGFSVAATLGLVTLAWGWSGLRAQPVVVWHPPTAMRHVALLLNLPVFALLLAAFLPGRVQRAAREPMLVAVKLWATAHLLANGTLADMILFGAFLAWAVADRIALARHPQPRPLPMALARAGNDAIVIGGGLALYAAMLLWGHRALIGVSPLGAAFG